MLGRLTDFVSSPRGKWITVAVWIIAAGLLISQLPRLSEASENEQALFLPRDAEATRAYEFARDRFPSAGTPVLIVFRDPAGLGPAAYAAAGEIAAWLSGPDAPDNVGEVLSPDAAMGQRSGLVSSDGTTMYVFAEVAGEPAEDAFTDTVEAIRDRSASLGLTGVRGRGGRTRRPGRGLRWGVLADRHPAAAGDGPARVGVADHHLPARRSWRRCPC